MFTSLRRYPRSTERLCNGTRCPSVCPYVCLSRRPKATATCSWFAAARAQAADIDRYLPPAPEQRASSMRHAESRGTRLNTDLLFDEMRNNISIYRVRMTDKCLEVSISDASSAFTGPAVIALAILLRSMRGWDNPFYTWLKCCISIMFCIDAR